MRNEWPFAIVWLCAAFTLMILIGCGGGGDGSDPRDEPPVDPAAPATKEQLLRSIEATVSAFEQEAKRGKALEKVSISNQLAVILDREDIHLIPTASQDECLTVTTRDETTLLYFDGTARCNGFSGMLEITPVAGDPSNQDDFTNDIKMIDFSTGDGCPVTGKVTSQMTLQGNLFTDDSTYANLDVCGQEFSGQVMFSGKDWDVERSHLNARTYTFDNKIKVDVEAVWQIDTSTLNGDSLVNVDDHSLPTGVDGISFTNTCNLPIGGTLTISDPNGTTTIADFSNTTCDQPLVTVEYEGGSERCELTAHKNIEEDQEPITPGVTITGQVETVYDWSKDKCIEKDIPDFSARAFRDSNGKVHLIATHHNNRRMIGDTLDSVKRECNLIMASDHDPDPSMHNDNEWLTSFYTKDGKTIYALVINEYHGWDHDGQCQSGEVMKCWYTSITSAVSADSGLTYEQAQAPNHFVAGLPYQYIPDNSMYGLIGGSNIVFNENDNWFYNLIHVEKYGLQEKGVCIMRTKILSDPNSWRAWDGEGFNIKFIDPYTTEAFDPADHVCQPISYNEINKMSGHVTYNTFFDKYLMVSDGQVWDPENERLISGFFFSLSDDLIHWSLPKLIKEVHLWYPLTDQVDRFGYASLIDPEDQSRNFSISGRRPYLYYVKWHKLTSFNRDLVRVQIEFSKE